MGQQGFFDADRRLAALSEKGDSLETIAGLVPWESFRADIEAVVLTPEETKKSKAGRKPLDTLVLFRMLVLQALYNLSDEQIEYQVRDRLSFTRFLGLGFEDGIPDGTTLWLFREKLAQAGLIERRIRAIWLGACASSWSRELGVNLVLHAEALAFDDDRLGVVQDAIEDGGGQRAVVVEDL